MMGRIIVSVVVNAMTLAVVTWMFSDISYSGDLRFYVLGGVIIGFLNFFLKPLMKLFSLPLIFLTVGLFSLVINTVLFWLAMQMINWINLSGVSVQVVNGWTYFFAAIVFGLVNWFFQIFIKFK